jgi:hypothetical protein
MAGWMRFSNWKEESARATAVPEATAIVTAGFGVMEPTEAVAFAGIISISPIGA